MKPLPLVPLNSNEFTAEMLYDFTAREHDELTLLKGKRLLVRKEGSDGWSLCMDMETNHIGLVPSNYYQKIKLDDTAAEGPRTPPSSVRKNSVRALQEKLSLDVSKLMGPAPQRIIIPHNPTVAAAMVQQQQQHEQQQQQQQQQRQQEQSKPIHRLMQQQTSMTSNSFAQKQAPHMVESKRKQSKRNQVRHEILTTERSYVHGLLILQEYFAQPIKEKGIVSEQIYSKIFPLELSIITTVNCKFLQYLEQILSNMPSVDLDQINILGNPSAAAPEPEAARPTFTPRGSFRIDPMRSQSSQLATLLLHYAHSFKLYSDYINRYQILSTTLREEMKKNKKLSSFLQKQKTKLMEKGERAGGLIDYAITPVQRLPRYKLLFEDLLFNTESTHDSYKLLEQASIFISEIARFCNDKGRELDNQVVLIELAKRMKMLDFLKPHRKLLFHSIQQPTLLYVKKEETIDCDFYILSDMLVIIPKGTTSTPTTTTSPTQAWKKRKSTSEVADEIIIQQQLRDRCGLIQQVNFMKSFVNATTSILRIETVFVNDSGVKSSDVNCLYSSSQQVTKKVEEVIKSITAKEQ